MGKKKTASDTDPAGPSFEESIERLQGIVGTLEAGTLGLEESMQQFETGVQLLKSCYQVLEQAEQRIEILTGLDAQGNPQTAPFDATATASQQEKAAGRRRTSGKLLDMEEDCESA